MQHKFNSAICWPTCNSVAFLLQVTHMQQCCILTRTVTPSHFDQHVTRLHSRATLLHFDPNCSTVTFPLMLRLLVGCCDCLSNVAIACGMLRLLAECYDSLWKSHANTWESCKVRTPMHAYVKNARCEHRCMQTGNVQCESTDANNNIRCEHWGVGQLF